MPVNGSLASLALATTGCPPGQIKDAEGVCQWIYAPVDEAAAAAPVQPPPQQPPPEWWEDQPPPWEDVPVTQYTQEPYKMVKPQGKPLMAVYWDPVAGKYSGPYGDLPAYSYAGVPSWGDDSLTGPGRAPPPTTGTGGGSLMPAPDLPSIWNIV